jgi:hypothetical protein
VTPGERPHPIDPPVRIGHVHRKVTDLERALQCGHHDEALRQPRQRTKNPCKRLVYRGLCFHYPAWIRTRTKRTKIGPPCRSIPLVFKRNPLTY